MPLILIAAALAGSPPCRCPGPFPRPCYYRAGEWSLDYGAAGI